MSSKTYRKNNEIKARRVRVIDSESGEMLGELPLFEALRLAEEKGVDLVEVSPKADVPVCKLMDFGQFLYKQKKQEQKNKKNQKQSEVKSIRLSFRIGENDLEIKLKKAKEFLQSGNMVRFMLRFRGREITHMDLGIAKMDTLEGRLAEVAQLEQKSKKGDNPVVYQFSPKKK